MFFLEIGLRLTGIYSTYSEKIGKGFSTYYGQTRNSHYWTWAPNDTFLLDHKVFQYTYHTNSLGLRGPEPVLAKNGKCRIITLGDSFTEGVGCERAEAWPLVLEKMQADLDVLNAGVSGSDPIYSYQLLQDKLLAYQPDLVLLAINFSDHDDLIYRGGFERFRADGTVQFNPGPWWIPLYRFVHSVRLVVHVFGRYDQNFQQAAEREAAKAQSVVLLCQAIEKFDSLGHVHGFEFMPIVHPMPNDANFWEHDWGFIKENLIPYLEEKEATYINLFPNFASFLTPENMFEYSWKVDGHFNANGYQKMGAFVYEELEEMGLLPCPGDTITGQPQPEAL
jgi:lysophospholipase L1-like esterase